MTRRRTKRRNWTQEETELLRHFVLTYGPVKGALEAQKELEATLPQIQTKIKNMRQAKVIVIEKTSKIRDPQTMAILKKYVSEYPNNLNLAFRLASRDTGLSQHTLRNGWYNKKSPLYRGNAGPCFMLVAKTKVAVNGKNCKKDTMLVRSRRAIKKFIIKAFGITRADLRS